jgi:hypothetical protein
MSIISTPHPRHRMRTRRDRPLWCSSCRSDAYLIIDTIGPLAPAETDVVEVSYTCIECDVFYAHPATVAQVARIMNRSDCEPGVLQFGGDYLHCGEPMKIQGSDLRGIYAPMHTDRPAARLPDAHLGTRVLHCRCGFQMEIPQDEGTDRRRTG